jgi:beta-lactamase class D
MRRKHEIMMTTFMRNGIEFLMKELKKSINNNNHHNNSSSPNRSDIINSSMKDSVIWTIQAVTVHLEVKTDLHKVGRKIIS